MMCSPVFKRYFIKLPGCLIVCSFDAEQEIIEDGKNGIIIKNFDSADAKRLSYLLTDTKSRIKITNNSYSTIKKISLKKWAREYLKELIK